ncbi:MAG: hypothetical protein IKT03_05555 [Muribaculaceae bacterium]|nr:hypothetical protein [Muribaculaceae bacterium]MBR5030876.1 hypothetical protein [Muribaculaceae bacterium]MBR6489984.1 hypothetical protein [Muribaculaceae bacterium]
MDKIQKDSLALKGYLDNLSRGGKTIAIDWIVEGCLVPRKTVYNWMHGLCRIPALHKCKIEEILGEKIFSAEEIFVN